MVYANTPEVVEALKGIDVLLMVSARENPERVEEHKEFLDAAKLAGVEHIVYTSFYGADEKATFHLVSRSCPDGSLYQGVRVHLYIFER